METPFQLEIHGIEPSAHVRELIDRHIDRLESRFGRLTACHVVIRSPGLHHHGGAPWIVSVSISLPASREVHVDHTPRQDERLADLDFAVNDAFRRATRQLVGNVERLRGRPAVRRKSLRRPAGEPEKS